MPELIMIADLQGRQELKLRIKQNDALPGAKVSNSLFLLKSHSWWFTERCNFHVWVKCFLGRFKISCWLVNPSQLLRTDILLFKMIHMFPLIKLADFSCRSLYRLKTETILNYWKVVLFVSWNWIARLVASMYISRLNRCTSFWILSTACRHQVSFYGLVKTNAAWTQIIS